MTAARGDAALVVFGACFGAAMVIAAAIGAVRAQREQSPFTVQDRGVVEGVAVCTPDPAGGPWVCRCGAPDGGAP